MALVRSGAARARVLDAGLDDDWSELVNGLLAYGSRSDSPETVIKAAGMVATALKALGPVAYSQWLKDDVGSLEAISPETAKAILAFPFPVLTTNYDTLLEEVGGRESRDWSDVRGFHEVVTRGTDAIGHIHGVWNRPESIILTEADYAVLQAHPSMQALEKAMATLKSIIYVGFGGGLSDPNFANLLAWHRATFPESSVTHFRLCKASEEANLLRVHANDHVVPVVYGDEHADLGPFLAMHAPASLNLVTNDAGLARDVVQEARDMLLESMNLESVLADAAVGDLAQRDLVIPPVLLPVPHATFVRERIRQGRSTEVERLDADAEVLANDFFVVVGDDGSGLTTTVKWIAARSSQILGSAAPLFVRFTDCRVRRDPLGIAIRNAALSSGIIPARESQLPPHVLAIDDVNPAVPRLSDAVLSHIVAAPSIVKVVGCRQGDEDQLITNLRSLGVSPRVVYLGRMRKSDIVALAERVSPGQGAHLAEEAARILEAEGLRRTPMTVSLLLFLLIRGGGHETRNQTSMLDAYTSLLLGFGDPHDNGTGLTETDLEAVLANYAESTIWDEKSSIPETEAIRIITEVIRKYGWTANASAVLNFFVQRRLLRRHGDSIEFARYAYLTLFAAKRALVDKDFRDLVVNDLFYYEPVAVKLAALARGDEDMLERLRPLLDEELAEETAPGSPYEPAPLITIEELPPAETPATPAVIDRDAQTDEIEYPESSSAGSFGLVKANMSQPSRLHRTLSLLSSVLRDLDQVENLKLKRELLVDTLELWGRFITVLSADFARAEVRSSIVEHLSTIDGEGKTIDDKVIDFLTKSIPAGTATGGIEATLVSPKLASVLSDAASRNELSTTNERTTASLLFLFLLKPAGWAEMAAALAENAEATWVLTKFYHALCQDAYAQGVEPEAELMRLCKLLYLKDHAFASADVQSAHVDRYAQGLRNARARSRHSATVT